MQTILVLTAVAAAAGYLGYKTWKAFFARKPKCDGCSFSQAARK